MNCQPPIILEGQDSLTAIISLGSNLKSALGSPQKVIGLASIELAALSFHPPIVSSLYETEPVDCERGTPNFINAAAAIFVSPQYSPEELLQQLHQIEASFGRYRGKTANAARILDLDLICFGLRISSEAGLEIPHPRAYQRRFVLQPIAELAPDLVLPGQTVTVQELLTQLPTAPAVTLLDTRK
jgi:2-amino-4-hydroxy-6-hydroxymethyldihydropteridine diphosphokinase